ncbi:MULTISPECIES: DUF2784 domain-containing protein [Nocardioides]|uniref:DUF2784 domain-containing protein n=1 Tax=Nocardioides vastitatis TaxID=2568655 RepID=A0ABW0ZGC4_9ACTN|nr:DUF2784 domain-containing protein [Nocardioides sp.]
MVVPTPVEDPLQWLAEAAAWATVVAHFAFLLYVVFGGFLGMLQTRWLWMHLASLAWSITVTATTLTCPLTGVEKWLIRQSGGTPYDGTFIDHYLEGPLYPVGYDAHVWYGGAFVALTSYGVVAVRRHRLKAPVTASG